MSVCCVRGCWSRYVYGGRNKIRFHNLPQGLRNVQRRQMWEHNIGKKLTAKSAVCEKHFTSDQYEQNRADGKKPLKWNAVPTIFPFKRLKKELPIHPSNTANIASNKDKLNDGADVKQTINLPSIRLVANFSTNPDASGAKMEMPHGFVPIAPKIEPNLQQAVAIIPIQTMLQNDRMSKEMQLCQEELKMSNRKLKGAIDKIKSLEKQMSKIDQTLKAVFNTDQLKYMGCNESKEDFEWNEDTLERATELYLICGCEGYELLLTYNLPYPSLDILKQCKPEFF